MLGLSVRKWAAWAPGFELAESKEIPPMLRRRMSRLNRMALSAAFTCCREAGVAPAEVNFVLASRHGDMAATTRLLGQLAAGEPPSPADFTHSVHHTAAGFWGIITGNKLTSRAVAGGEASFCAGWLDAAGILARQPQRPVLLISADDALPAPFDGLVGQGVPHAAALLLVPGKIKLEPVGPGVGKADQPAALAFLNWHINGGTELALDLDGRRWRWAC